MQTKYFMIVQTLNMYTRKNVHGHAYTQEKHALICHLQQFGNGRTSWCTPNDLQVKV